MGFHQTYSILFFSSSLIVLPDIELLTRKASSSIWPEKVEILYKARKEKQSFFCVWLPQQCSPHIRQFLDATFRASSKKQRRWHSVFHVIAYSLDEVNITLSYDVCHKQTWVASLKSLETGCCWLTGHSSVLINKAWPLPFKQTCHRLTSWSFGQFWGRK